MDAVDHLAQGLVAEHGVRSLEELGYKADLYAGLDVVAAKDHWGSVGLVGLVRADGLDDASITARADTFDELTRSLHKHARVLTIYTQLGQGSVRLGSFGVLCYVFERGASKEQVDLVRRQRRGSPAKKEYTLAWSLDVPAARVHDHGLLPRGVFPSKKWVATALRTRPMA